jgi:predicted CoA-binding protein
MAHVNPSDQTLRELLSSSKTIAVVGASSDPARASNRVFAQLLAAGYTTIPVNPNESEVHGVKAYASLRDVPGSVDIVNVFRRPQFTPELADDAVAIGARSLWLQLGIMNETAAESAARGGLVVVMNRCIAIELNRLRVTRS